MYRKRQVFKDLSHAEQHLENALTNGNNDMRVHVRMALGIIKEAVKREKEARRNYDKKGVKK